MNKCKINDIVMIKDRSDIGWPPEVCVLVYDQCDGWSVEAIYTGTKFFMYESEFDVMWVNP